jgi:hypothetical protein
VDPEFQRALTIVLIAGGAIGVIGAAVLFFAFRLFAGREAGGRKHIAVLASLIAFIFVCCFVLFILSYAER